MCVLTRPEILREIREGRLQIDPFEPEQVGPASIDLHLGHEIRVLSPDHRGPIHVTEEADHECHTDLIEIGDYYLLGPGEIIHGITAERLVFPPNLCAWIEGRSRFARLGLTVHVSSGFVQPGIDNRQVLEMANVSTVPLAIYPGVRICQIVLERTEGEAVYRGRFAVQISP